MGTCVSCFASSGPPERDTTSTLNFSSGGFTLYVPPTPFCIPPERARFVMVDDQNDRFYDIDYETLLLGNTTAWEQVALHRIKDPAIVFPPKQEELLRQNQSILAIGFLVSIEERNAAGWRARKLGQVGVRAFPQGLMSWSALESQKGPVLPAEMRAGLLRKVFRRDGAAGAMTYVTSLQVLNAMPRPWHRDGAWLNYELDSIFVGGQRVGSDQNWELFE